MPRHHTVMCLRFTKLVLNEYRKFPSLGAQGEPQPLNPKGKKSEVNQCMVVEFFWVVHYYEFSAEAASPFRLGEGEKLAVP